MSTSSTPAGTLIEWSWFIGGQWLQMSGRVTKSGRVQPRSYMAGQDHAPVGTRVFFVEHSDPFDRKTVASWICEYSAQVRDIAVR